MGESQLLDETLKVRDDATRRDALAASIAIWLGTLNLAELERMDATLAQVLRDRDQTWWARHSSSSEWHFVVEVSGGSVVIACNGRWSIHDTFETEARPARADRCEACQCLYEASRIMNAGLRELRDAKATTTRAEVSR
jgi:hypothetical protein